MHQEWWDEHLEAWDQHSSSTKATAKIERVKTVRTVILAMQVMTDALREDVVEGAIAERLGITSLLVAKKLDLKAEKTILTAWSRRAQS